MDSERNPSAAEQAGRWVPVARVADVHMSRYTIEWLDKPMPEGTVLFADVIEWAANAPRRRRGAAGFESGLVQLLNEARCLSKETVGNRELASRIIRYMRMHAPQPVAPAGQAARDWRDEVQRNESYWREEAEEFKKYLADCDRCAIVPDAAGAFAAAWQAAKPRPAGQAGLTIDTPDTLMAGQSQAFCESFRPGRIHISTPAGQAAAGVQRDFRAVGWMRSDGSLHKGCPPLDEPSGWVAIGEIIPAPAVERGVAEEQTAAARDVLAERQRQISAEGWSPEHDDEHAGAEMARAAACYALNAAGVRMSRLPEDLWPWSTDWWKPDAPRRSLVKAGALILAEIERLDRAALSTAGKEQA